MLVEKFQRLFPVKVGLLKGNCFFLLFLRRKKERQLPLSFPWKEEAALRALVQTSPTRARGLWSGVFFSIEVNPNTVCSGPTGFFVPPVVFCARPKPAYFAFECLQHQFTCRDSWIKQQLIEVIYRRHPNITIC